MKSSYRAKVMFRVLLCSKRDLRPELANTFIGRQGIEVYRVENLPDARLVGSSLGVQVILVDREFPDASGFILQLRQEAATRNRSIALLTRSAGNHDEFLKAGANAVFRLPPDTDWDERFSKLLTVPVRQQARMVTHIEVETGDERVAAILNLSPGGMLLTTQKALKVEEELQFRFKLPDKREVKGRGRVARIAPPNNFGVEFLELDEDSRTAVHEFLRGAQME